MDIVSLVQELGLAILLVLVVAIIVIAVRRSVLTRSGAVDICWRRTLSPDGNGWVVQESPTMRTAAQGATTAADSAAETTA